MWGLFYIGGDYMDKLNEEELSHVTAGLNENLDREQVEGIEVREVWSLENLKDSKLVKLGLKLLWRH